MKPKTKKPVELSTQEAYVKEHKSYHRKITFCRILIFILFLFVWELAADLGWMDAFFFSSPSRVLQCFLSLLKDNNLVLHIGITLYETILSFLLVFFIGMLLATLLWYSNGISEILEPYLVILNSLPKSALAPLFIVWLGTGSVTIIVAGISVALFGSIISLYAGFKNVDPEKITLIYTLGGHKKDAFFKVVLPASIPTVLSTMKVNIGLSLVGVIIGEFLAARRGLGYQIIYGSQVFKMHMVITSIILLCIIAMALYLAIGSTEHYYRKKTGIK